MALCRCPMPDPSEAGACRNCGEFACPYAGRGQAKCSSAICDCFVDTYPDSPFDLHPEAFVVTWPDSSPPRGGDPSVPECRSCLRSDCKGGCL